MTELILHPLADKELSAQAEYYEHKREGLGREFLHEVERTLDRIAAHPEAGRPAPLPLRTLRVRRFPHSVIYGSAGLYIYIVAIAHHRREPGYWRDRI